MIIECQTCHARFRLDESRIKGRGARVKCRKCGDSIVVLKDDAPAPAPPAPGGDGFFDLSLGWDGLRRWGEFRIAERHC